MNAAGIGQLASANVERKRGLGDRVGLGGVFHVECYRDGKLLWTEDCENQVKDEGAKQMLNSALHGTAAITAWFIGLITAGGSIQTAADTMASHAGWTENVSYDEAARVAWDEGAASGSSGVLTMTSATTADFTISASVTIDGIFITSVNTKSGTTGTLWCTAPFASQQVLVDNDVLKVTYTVTMTVTGT